MSNVYITVLYVYSSNILSLITDPIIQRLLINLFNCSFSIYLKYNVGVSSKEASRALINIFCPPLLCIPGKLTTLLSSSYLSDNSNNNLNMVNKSFPSSPISDSNELKNSCLSPSLGVTNPSSSPPKMVDGFWHFGE